MSRITAGSQTISAKAQVARFACSYESESCSLHPDLVQTEMAMRALDPDSSLTLLGKELQSRGIEFFVAVKPRKGFASCVNRLPILKMKSLVTFMNIRTAFKRLVKENGYTEGQLNLPHDLHPSALRAGLYADLMVPYLKAGIAGHQAPE